ncbi:MAG TPA: vWA domain-containing protein [Blastocatellia bacterium]|nr:vWA domain-containing protein [Blastocatellia bacterium]
MTYTAEISRTNPSCFLFLVDQSGSMKDGFGGDSSKKKADSVADVINRLLQNLVIKCAKSEGVRDYYHVGVIGYGNEVKPILSGNLAGKDLIRISEVAEQPARIEERTKKVEDGAGGLVEQTVKFPVWLEPVAEGGTPMCRAFGTAETILSGWLCEHRNSFPPIVINLTDGESTDGDPAGPADRLRQLSTDDGQVLLFNIHLSSHQSAPIQFPDTATGLPDQYAQLLFKLSSPLPSYMTSIAREEGFKVTDTSRGFVFNADMISLISFLDIGTRPGNLR